MLKSVEDVDLKPDGLYFSTPGNIDPTVACAVEAAWLLGPRLAKAEPEDMADGCAS